MRDLSAQINTQQKNTVIRKLFIYTDSACISSLPVQDLEPKWFFFSFFFFFFGLWFTNTISISMRTAANNWSYVRICSGLKKRAMSAFSQCVGSARFRLRGPFKVCAGSCRVAFHQLVNAVKSGNNYSQELPRFNRKRLEKCSIGKPQPLQPKTVAV